MPMFSNQKKKGPGNSRALLGNFSVRELSGTCALHDIHPRLNAALDRSEAFLARRRHQLAQLGELADIGLECGLRETSLELESFMRRLRGHDGLCRGDRVLDGLLGISVNFVVEGLCAFA